MSAAAAVVTPVVLATKELEALEGMLDELPDYPLLVVPNKVPSIPPAAEIARLRRLTETAHVRLCRPRCLPRAGLPWTPGQPSASRRIPDDRFSCSTPAPAMSSRHLYTGHRQGNTQTAPWLRTHPRARLYPGDTHNLRFRCQRSTFRCVSSGSHMFVFSSLT